MKISKERLKRVWGVPLVLRVLNPSYGHCAICGLPWNHAEIHDVHIDRYRGWFAVCEHCHRHASDEKLNTAYRKTLEWVMCKNNLTYKEYKECVSAYKRDIESRGKEKKHG